MNSISKYIVLLAFLVSTSFYGQRRPDREKINSLKVAFITERLDLSSSEAEAFWPVYNDHEAKLDDLRKMERSEIRTKLRTVDDLSEKEADKLLQLAMKIESDKSKLNIEYFNKLNGIISSKKTILLMKAEEDFKRKLIKEYRNKRGSHGGGLR